MKGSELLEEAMEHRLRMIIPFVNNWPQVMRERESVGKEGEVEMKTEELLLCG